MTTRLDTAVENGRIDQATADEKAAIRRGAADARQTMTAYILSLVLGRNGGNAENGLVLPPVASEAVQAMQVAGISRTDAQKRIGAALKESPTGTTEELLHLAFKNNGEKTPISFG